MWWTPSWDIPPLTFPKLQPTDSEEADGADGASLAEPRTIASSVPAQTEQPVSAAPTIADIPSMPLDTIDFDDAVAPADAEETATLPPSSLRQMNRTSKQLRPLTLRMA